MYKTDTLDSLPCRTGSRSAMMKAERKLKIKSEKIKDKSEKLLCRLRRRIEYMPQIPRSRRRGGACPRPAGECSFPVFARARAHDGGFRAGRPQGSPLRQRREVSPYRLQGQPPPLRRTRQISSLFQSSAQRTPQFFTFIFYLLSFHLSNPSAQRTPQLFIIHY